MPPADARPEPAGRIRLLEDARGTVLVLAGEIDSHAVQEFERRTPLGTAGGLVTVVETSAVTFLDSQGLSFVARATRPVRSTGRLPHLPAPSPVVVELLRLTGLTGLFDLR